MWSDRSARKEKENINGVNYVIQLTKDTSYQYERDFTC